MESSDRRDHSLHGMERLAGLALLGAGKNDFKETAGKFDFWVELLLSHHFSDLMAALKRLACFEVLFIGLFLTVSVLWTLFLQKFLRNPGLS